MYRSLQIVFDQCSCFVQLVSPLDFPNGLHGAICPNNTFPSFQFSFCLMLVAPSFNWLLLVLFFRDHCFVVLTSAAPLPLPSPSVVSVPSFPISHLFVSRSSVSSSSVSLLISSSRNRTSFGSLRIRSDSVCSHFWFF